MASLDFLEQKLVRIQSRIERWESHWEGRDPSARALRRYEKWTARAELTQGMIDDIEPVIEEPVIESAATVEEPQTALSTFKLAEITVPQSEPESEFPSPTQEDLPKDTVLIQYEPADENYGFDRLQFTVFDSPWDDTFEAGDPLKMQVQGVTTGLNRRGNFSTRTWTNRSSLANGDYWTDGAYFETVVAGGSFIKQVQALDEVTVTVALDNGSFGEFDEENILATQVISTPELA